MFKMFHGFVYTKCFNLEAILIHGRSNDVDLEYINKGLLNLALKSCRLTRLALQYLGHYRKSAAIGQCPRNLPSLRSLWVHAQLMLASVVSFTQCPPSIMRTFMVWVGTFRNWCSRTNWCYMTFRNWCLVILSHCMISRQIQKPMVHGH